MKESNIVADDNGFGDLKGDFDRFLKGGGRKPVPKRVTAGLDAMLGKKASITTLVVAS